MRLWIDNDACPREVREIVMRGSQRLKLPLTFVANAMMRLPVFPLWEIKVVSGDFDAADHYIADHCQAGDLVITNDVPLAARVVEKKAWAISPRGEIFSAESIGEQIALRNLRQELRGAGTIQGGPASPGEKDRKRFADSFDRLSQRLAAQAK